MDGTFFTSDGYIWFCVVVAIIPAAIKFHSIYVGRYGKTKTPPERQLRPFYVLHSPSGAMWVKEAEHFIQQGGTTHQWGKAWMLIQAYDIEHAKSVCLKQSLMGRPGYKDFLLRSGEDVLIARHADEPQEDYKARVSEHLEELAGVDCTQGRKVRNMQEWKKGLDAHGIRSSPGLVPVKPKPSKFQHNPAYIPQEQRTVAPTSSDMSDVVEAEIISMITDTTPSTVPDFPVDDTPAVESGGGGDFGGGGSDATY